LPVRGQLIKTVNGGKLALDLLKKQGEMKVSPAVNLPVRGQLIKTVNGGKLALDLLKKQGEMKVSPA
ncbi:hypothetical protein, partial [Shigella sp. FC2710]|uniref:hypothetical protein n=1 Tax=Shigella sp. FC2710 TaxID=1898676 RepID=UPI000ACB8C6B